MIYHNITETIGNTPLVMLNRIINNGDQIALKMESANPLSSVKDRIGLSMIRMAEKNGTIVPGSILVEPTSGNTGISLAFISASRGYRLILTMPESMSIERRKLLVFLGADLVLTPADQGMKGAIERAEEIVATTDGAVMLQQFENPANPDIHRETTAEEIWRDTDGNVAIFVAGVGTGGTLTGVGEVLKTYNSKIQIIAVEPEDSPILSGGNPGPHKIQGIGAGFIPKVLNTDVIDEIITIGNVEAIKTSQKLARLEGILVGISAGANVAAALKVAKRKENEGKLIVTVGCDTGERYLSTELFSNIQ